MKCNEKKLMSFVPLAKAKGSWKYAGTQYELSMIKYVIIIVLNKMVLLYLNSLQQSLVITAI